MAKTPALELYQKGNQALKEKNFYQAADFFKLALKENPYYKEALEGAGNAYYEMQNYLEARKYYEQALNFDPENITYMLRLAHIKIQTSLSPKEYLGAEFYLLKAFKKEPRNPKVLMAYGDYYYALNQWQEALNFYEKARRSQENFMAYLRMAKIYLKWGQNEKARDFLLKAENLNSMHYLVTFELGKFYLIQKDFEMAQKYLELTLKFYPEFKEGLLKIIHFYILQKDYSAAITKTNELLKLDPENPLLYYYMGVCFDNLGQIEDALRFLKNGRKYDFSNEPLRIKAEEIAVKNLPLGHTVRKELAEFYLLQAREYYVKKQNPQAILYYKRGLRINPLSVEIRKELAQIYREKGWIDLYLRTIEAGIFTNPKNQELKDIFELNQRFLWDTLSYKEKINQYQTPAFFPILYLGNSIHDPENLHPHFFTELKELVMEGLVNTYSLNVKELEDKDLHKVKKNNSLFLRLRYYEDDRKIELEGEIVSLATGNIFKKYSVRRYGNLRVTEAILELSKQIAADIIPFGRIIKIDDDKALINIGSLQNIKVKDKFTIMKSQEVIDDYFSNSLFRSHFIIGEAEVLEIDEHLALVKLKKDKAVVFNLINVNDIVMVKKEDESLKEAKQAP